MLEQTALQHPALIGLPKLDPKTLENCDESALFHALHRLLTDTKSAAPVAGFNAVAGSARRDGAEPVDDR